MGATLIRGKFPEHSKFFIDPNGSGIPFDVTFVIKENENLDTEEVNEVRAHKHVLALYSDVFKTMFFGPLKETEDNITIKDTTFEAFKKLMEYIYQVDIECKNISLLELFNILNLAEKYNVSTFKEALETPIVKYPLTIENLMDVVETASKYSHFEAVSSALLLACAKFFQKTVGPEYDDQMPFVMEQYARGRGEIALKLMSILASLPKVCYNCREEECLVDQPVMHLNVRQNLQVKININSQNYWGPAWSNAEFNVDEFKPSENVGIYDVRLRDTIGRQGWFKTEYQGQRTLCYNC